jgi:prephenate dehydrogenase
VDNHAKIVLYGVGLINGSLGLALKARGFAGRVVGIGRRAETLEIACEVGAVDEWTLDPADGLRQARLVVIGTPVDCVAATVKRLTEHAEPDALFTDVGSVKAGIVRDCARLAPTTHFVGAHPIAGSERMGAKAARADLFENAVCVLTPSTATHPEDVQRIHDLWERVGARVVEMSPEVHDALLAASSHLPHVVASALARVVADTVVDGRPALDFAAGGFRDTTRIAAGSVEMWTPILRENAVEIAAAVRRFSRELDTIADAIEADDADAIREWLRRSSSIRRRFEENPAHGF